MLLAACSHPLPAQNANGTDAPRAAKESTAKEGPPPPISPEFSLSLPDLRAMVGKMPASIARRILDRPRPFLSEMAEILKQPSIYFVLVDKQHALPADYVPPDLVNLYDAGLAVSRADLVLRKSIMPRVLAMVKQARQDHVELLFSSTYRSYSLQRRVYDQEVKLYGKKVADTESAVPGTSQHQLGDTIDFGCICDAFAKTPAFRWLGAHAASFGFSMTYPQSYEAVTGYRYEPWHWHYITTAGTRAQADFFDNVQQYLLLFLYENRGQLVESYFGGDLGPGWLGGEIVTAIGPAAGGSAAH